MVNHHEMGLLWLKTTPRRLSWSVRVFVWNFHDTTMPYDDVTMLKKYFTYFRESHFLTDFTLKDDLWLKLHITWFQNLIGYNIKNSMPRQPIYTCGECGSNFTSQRKFTRHKQQHKTSKLDNTTKIEKKPNEVKCKVFGCPYTSTARNLCHH